MKDFLKYLLASILGFSISVFLLFFVVIAIFIGVLAVSSTTPVTPIMENSVLKLNLNGILVERSRLENPIMDFLQEDFKEIGLEDVLHSIDVAKNHQDIKGIYLNCAYLEAGIASLEEIRDALSDFKQSGKFIVAYSDTYTQGLYYLASVADKILLNPRGTLEWKGLSAQPMFYKDLLKNIGVEMQIFKVGTYKAAVEPFILDEMSEANREQVTAYIGSIWNNIVENVSVSRNISVQTLNKYADDMMMFEPTDWTVSTGMVDTLLYKNDVNAYISSFVGGVKDINVLGVNDLKNIEPIMNFSAPTVAVYYAYGDIDGFSGDGIKSNKVIRDLKKLEKDDNVKAVVLRVNSPGGSAFGSEQLWYAVSQLKKQKPVVVSMGDYAASGGYYMSCCANAIVAQPTTLTGSIGIFGMIPNTEELTQKIGLDFDVVKTNRYADIGAMGRAMNIGEKQLIQKSVDAGYRLFLTRCSEGRNMEMDSLAKIAEGRVWTGAMAKELSLVDALGGLNKAITMAADIADISTYNVASYPTKKDFFTELLEMTINPEYIKSTIASLFVSESLLNLSNAVSKKEFDVKDLVQARGLYECVIQ